MAGGWVCIDGVDLFFCCVDSRTSVWFSVERQETSLSDSEPERLSGLAGRRHTGPQTTDRRPGVGSDPHDSPRGSAGVRRQAHSRRVAWA